jgi:hypothetical protein
MTECKRYNMGENHYKWALKVICYNHYDNYKYLLLDWDEEESEYIGTNNVTAATATILEKAIYETLENSSRFEDIKDVFAQLQKTPLGCMFYMRNKISPQLTDGVLILAN